MTGTTNTDGKTPAMARGGLQSLTMPQNPR